MYANPYIKCIAHYKHMFMYIFYIAFISMHRVYRYSTFESINELVVCGQLSFFEVLAKLTHKSLH